MSQLPMAVDVDTSERLSADDMATRLEAQFLNAALAAQRRQALAAAAVGGTGVCRYCRQQCLPLAVYCDEDCQADHENEVAVLRRQGRVR